MERLCDSRAGTLWLAAFVLMGTPVSMGCGEGGSGPGAGSGALLAEAGTTGVAGAGVAGTGAAGTAAAGTAAAGVSAVAGTGVAGTGVAGTAAAGTGVAAGTGAMAGTGDTAGTGAMAGTGDMAGTGAMAGMAPMAGTMPMAGMGPVAGTGTGDGECCDDGDCLCHGPAPTELTGASGPYNVDSYDLRGAGCVYYPTDAEPPFAAVAVSDGFLGSGGCSALAQTSGWGPLYASHGIVTMIIHTTGSDQPPTRGRKLTGGIEAFKQENEMSGSRLFGQLSGRYGTSGFSMGGGGTSYSSQGDATLKSSVAIMPWGPVRNGIEVPTLVICGSSDGIAPCSSHGNPLYRGIPDSVPKKRSQRSAQRRPQPLGSLRPGLPEVLPRGRRALVGHPRGYRIRGDEHPLVAQV